MCYLVWFMVFGIDVEVGVEDEAESDFFNSPSKSILTDGV